MPQPLFTIGVIGLELHLGTTDVTVVAPLGVLLGSLEELLSLGREGLLERRVTYLAHQEVLELRPIRLLRVEYAWVVALILEKWIVVPEVPVTTLYGLLTDSLSTRHTALDTVVDTWSISDNE